MVGLDDQAVRVRRVGFGHGHVELSTQKMVPPSMATVHHGQQLLLMDRVISFGRDHRPGDILDRLETETMVLEQHTANSNLARIAIDHEWLGGIRKDEDRRSGEPGLQQVKGLLTQA
eukprot:8922415-Prorocentrum_lima.AAC.1